MKNFLSLHGRVLLFLCLFLSLFTIRSDAGVVCNTTVTAPVVDFAFLVDVSGSMCPYIEELTDSLAYFALQLQNRNVNARFAIVVFGGFPMIVQPFTPDATLTASTLKALGCNGGGQEASLEAIRAVLAPNYGADLMKGCQFLAMMNNVKYNKNAPCNIIWRTDAKKNIIVVTDEDSDLPMLSNYRTSGQTNDNSLCALQYYQTWDGKVYCDSSYAQFEPNWEPKAFWSRYGTFFRTDKGLTISAPFQAEIDLTASLVVANDVSVNVLMNAGVNPATSNPQSYYDSRNLYWIATKSNSAPSYKDSLQTTISQFGDPALAVMDVDTLLKFNAAQTLSKLNSNGLSKSLQARVLAAGGFLRLFDINNLLKTTTSSNGNNFAENFYNATVNSVTTCINVPDANPPADLPPPILSNIAPIPASLLTTTTTRTTSTTTSTTSTKTTTTSTTTTPTTTTTSTTKTSTTTTTTTTPTTTSTTTSSSTATSTTSTTKTTTTTSTSTSTTTTPTTTTTSTTTTSTSTTPTTTTTSSTTTTDTTTTSSTTTSTSTTTTDTTTTTSTTSTSTTTTDTTSTTSTSTTTTDTTTSTSTTTTDTTTTTSTTATDTTTTTSTSTTTTDTTTTSSTSTTTTDTTTTTSTSTTTTDTTTTTSTSTTTTDTTSTTSTSTTTTDTTSTTSTSTTTTTSTISSTTSTTSTTLDTDVNTDTTGTASPTRVVVDTTTMPTEPTTTTDTTTTTSTTTTETTTSTSTTTTDTTTTTSTTTSTSTTTTDTTTTTSTTTTDTTSTTSTTTTDTTTTTSTTTTDTTSTTSTTTTDTTSTTSTTSSTTTTTSSTSTTTTDTTTTTSTTTTDTTSTTSTTTTDTTSTTSTTTTDTTTTTSTTTTDTTTTTTSTTTSDTTTTTSTTTTSTTTSDTTTSTTTTTTDTTTTTSTTTTDTTTTSSTSTTTTDTTTTTTDTTTTTSTTSTTTTTTDTTTTTTDPTTTTDTTTTTTTPDGTTTVTSTTSTSVTPPNIFCGSGVVGNGTCARAGQCCSGYGWCDIGPDYCGVTNNPVFIDPQDQGQANTTTPGSDSCGYGVIGNGVCEDELLSCSKWGWCLPQSVTDIPRPAPTYDPNQVIHGTETPTPSADASGETKSTDSNTVVAGGVGAGVLCVGAITAFMVLRRNRGGSMISMTSSESGDVFGSRVADNPLYARNGNYVENPLYKVSSSQEAV